MYMLDNGQLLLLELKRKGLVRPGCIRLKLSNIDV